MSFEDKIKSWVSYDTKIKQLNEQTKDLRNKRNELTSDINAYVTEQNLRHATIKISDGELKFQNVKVTQSITLKFIKECLEECINNEDQVEKIMNYIKNRREVKYVEDIKRSYN